MKFRITAIGEILWDLLPSGRHLGGAPANYAYHAHALGAEARVVSRVGNDALGREIIERLERLGLRTDFVTVDPSAPTGTVSVELSANGQPKFTIHQNVAWDRIEASEAAFRAVADADAVCFGSLAQRAQTSRQAVQTLVAATPAHALRIFDINLRQHYYSPALIERSLQLANALKLNDAELPVVARMFGLDGAIPDQLNQLRQRFNLRLVALTRGGQGSLLCSPDGMSDHPGLPAEVKDTIGAGDAFTAAMTMGVLSNWPLDRVNQAANKVARFVCASHGGTPPLPAELRGLFPGPN